MREIGGPDINKKQLILLRWISITVGGLLPLERKDRTTARVLEKKGLVCLTRSISTGHGEARLTQGGREYLRNYDDHLHNF